MIGPNHLFHPFPTPHLKTFQVFLIYIYIGAKGKIFFSSPKHPGRLWRPTSLLFKKYRGCCPRLNWLGRDTEISDVIKMSVGVTLFSLHELMSQRGR